jgi:hypothetical protein
MDDKIFTWYSITHFLIYFVISLYYPNKWIIIIIISIVWEILEMLLNIVYNKVLNLGSNYWDEISMNKVVDVMFNLLGYGAGHLYQKYILHSKNINI